MSINRYRKPPIIIYNSKLGYKQGLYQLYKWLKETFKNSEYKFTYKSNYGIIATKNIEYDGEFIDSNTYITDKNSLDRFFLKVNI